VKAAAFDYIRPDNLEAVISALSQVGDEACIIAGGQTLVPLMAMRLVRPSLLIDINHVENLAGIYVEGDDLVIKACTRQAIAERSMELRSQLPLLAKALGHVGHTQTRNRGTVGGSVANADPAAEIPVVAQTLNAAMVMKSTKGERTVRTGDFFFSAMDTAVEDEECLLEVRFPIWREDRVGTGFQEVSIRDSDFALVAAAAQLAVDEDGQCVKASVTVGGCAPVATNIAGIADALIGTDLSDEAIKVAAGLVLDAIDPDSDVHATSDYRKRVAGKIVERVLFEARLETRLEIRAEANG
jgi:CO/xanthine dehydrogenase FAD-binding subunit